MATSSPSPSSFSSPKWGSTAKLVVGLSFGAIILAALFYFRSIIGPLLLAFILTYLFHPLAARISKLTKLSWRVSVNLIYLVVAVILLVSITLTGLAVVQQIQNLVDVVRNFVNDLPQIIADLSARTYHLGPFQLNLSQYDINFVKLSQEILSYLQPMLGKLGDLVGKLVTGGATVVGWMIFVLLVSYFILADASRVPEELLYVEIPGYDSDVRRLGRELGRTWNAFLRGQLVMFLLVVVSYTILMTALGVRYSYAIALLAGFARFVPYIGPWATWSVLGLVTFFQGDNYFQLLPWQYTLLAIVLGIILDQIFDNIVSPRLMGQTLGVHPAAVLVAAIIAANLIGLVGLVLAAPALATVTIMGRYAIRKMLDLDPWPESEEEEIEKAKTVQGKSLRRFKAWWRTLKQRLKRS